MKTCDACAHWNEEERARGLNGLGSCNSPKWVQGYSVDQEDIEPDSVMVEDDEGWAFYTGPKFGCVHWRSVNGSGEL